jgi:hypothetical protein
VEEAGWTVQREPAGLTASRTGVSRDESATAGVEFTIDAMAVAQPAWQYHRARAREFALASRLRRTVHADRRRGRAGHDAPGSSTAFGALVMRAGVGAACAASGAGSRRRTR